MTTKQKIYVIMFLLVAFGGAYMLAVLAVWALLALLNAGFAVSLNWNVWIAGLIVWLAVGAFSGIRNLTKK